MEYNFTDFNGAAATIAAEHADIWARLEQVIRDMPLYLKASDQAGRIGNSIFDPVATNAAFEQHLIQPDWEKKHPVPAEFRFLGKNFDFCSGGFFLEVQFSNYPFLLNNMLRFELLHKARARMNQNVPRISVGVILTKGGMFPASNSTLYYEQAQSQLQAFADNGVFTVPLRLVGLFMPTGRPVPAIRTTYAARYARVAGEAQNVTMTFPDQIQVAPAEDLEVE